MIIRTEIKIGDEWVELSGDNEVGTLTRDVIKTGEMMNGDDKLAYRTYTYQELPLEDIDRGWRDDELNDTDKYMTLPDHPLFLNYQKYRAELRDWTGTAQFPGVRPTLNEAQLSIITQLAFLQRFSTEEYAALDIASIDDPSSDSAAREQQAALRKMLKQIDMATYIDLGDVDALLALQTMKTLGILTDSRITEITTNPILEVEKYKGPL